METKIIPAILAQDFDEFKEMVKLTENDFELLQIDAIDGQFVDNVTFYDVSRLNEIKTTAKFELHLMVNNPLETIRQIDDSRITRVIFHIEPVKNQIKEIITEIKNKGLKIGLALNPGTPLSEVEPFLNEIDMVLLMTVNPGWSGQGFLESSYEKIRELRKISQNIEIEVDGGVSPENIYRLIKAGVNSLAIGSALFKAKDIQSTIENLKEIVK